MLTMFTWVGVKHAVHTLLSRMRAAQRRMQINAIRDRIRELKQMQANCWFALSKITPEMQALEKKLFQLEKGI